MLFNHVWLTVEPFTVIVRPAMSTKTESPPVVSLPAGGLMPWLLARLPRPDAKDAVERCAKEAGVPFHTLLKICKGETVDPRGSTLEQLVRWALEKEKAPA